MEKALIFTDTGLISANLVKFEALPDDAWYVFTEDNHAVYVVHNDAEVTYYAVNQFSPIE